MAAVREDDDGLTVRYPPHHNTLTKSGSEHFECTKDALTEIFDNSIQANSGKEDRHIKLYLHVSEFQGQSFLIVWDNGRGMGIEDLKAYATYHLGQKER